MTPDRAATQKRSRHAVAETTPAGLTLAMGGACPRPTMHPVKIGASHNRTSAQSDRSP